jgi:hypothetical protein
MPEDLTPPIDPDRLTPVQRHRLRKQGLLPPLPVKTWFGLARSGEFYRVMVTNPPFYDEMSSLREKYCN